MKVGSNYTAVTAGEEILLSVKNLSKTFGSQKVVDDISFDIHKGQCFGLLGPNGAGKSTTIEMIEQIIPGDSGQIFFKGKKPDRSFLERLGVQFQATALPPHLTARECIQTFSGLYSASLPVAELLATCQIEEFQDRRHDKISGGQRQRLLLAVALCNDPDLLLLDEPTTGLDPKARRNLWEVVRRIKKLGKSIILTTHYMEEADELCDQLAIMNRGKIIALGSPSDLLLQNFDQVTITFKSQEDISSSLSDLIPEDQIFFKNSQMLIQTRHVSRVLYRLIHDKIPLNHLKIRESNLEDLFLKLTGGEMSS